MNCSETQNIENIEIELVIDAINRRYGYNFSHWARASLKRRVMHFAARNGFKKLSPMIPRLLSDKTFFEDLLYTISITVTEMFRDPHVYNGLREKVIPFLKTFPFVRIWNAGCATGEEAYSMAILLEEEGLYDRAQIYATDFNEMALEKARQGIYPVDKIKAYTTNYQKAGGQDSFARYYYSKYDSVIMDRDLRRNIVFANHNLFSDSVFGEMQLIMCRNVLIYFDKILQDQVLKLFYNSLAFNGFICLGTKESIRFSSVENRLNDFDDKLNIFQKKNLVSGTSVEGG